MRNAVERLNHIYSDTADLLVKEISSINNKMLSTLVDEKTLDEDCRSIQTILTHIIFSGRNYNNLVRTKSGLPKINHNKIFYSNVEEYVVQLNLLKKEYFDLFDSLKDKDLEETDENKKIMHPMGQRYDTEQLMEHAIVHNLRHLYQIRNFIVKIKNEGSS